MNDDGRAARRYHEATKHSVESLRRERHGLDWPNQPLPWKLYETPLAVEHTGRGLRILPDRWA